MAKKSYSNYPIPDLDFNADWSRNARDGKPQSGAQVTAFLNNSLRGVARAVFFDPVTFSLLFFKSDADKQRYIDDPTGSTSLILFRETMSFTGTVKRVNIINNNGRTQINVSTNMTEAIVSFNYQLVEKAITESQWQQLEDSATVIVYVDNGTGYREIARYLNVEHSDPAIEINVRPFLIEGNNKIRVTAIANDSEGTTGNLVYNVTLANMYIENFDYEGLRNSYWYRPVIEGVSSANDYQLGGFRIVGTLSKTLHIDIYADRESELPVLCLEKTIGMNEYVSYPYSFNKNVGLDLSSLATGSYVGKVYLTSGEGDSQISTEDAAIEYPFMYIAQADQGTAQLVVVHNIEPTVYNATTAKFCDFAVYNKGNSEASPVRAVQQYLGTETYGDPIVKDGKVLCEAINSVQADISIESESTQPGFLYTETEITLGEASVSFQTAVDNSNTYPAVGGYDFYLNPSTRTNGDTNRENIINAVNGTEYSDVTWGKTSFVDGVDGWDRDENQVSCLRITAGGKMTLPASDFRLLQNGKNTIDLVYRVDNVSDADEPVITIALNASTAGFTGIKILPERILVHSSTDTSAVNDTNRGTHVKAGEIYHLMISIEPNYTTGKNLVTGWVNGCENFHFQYSGNFNFAADLVIGSDTADVNVYSLRHYSNALRHSSAEANFVASLRNRAEKIAAHEKIDSVINSSHDITFEKVKAGGYNYYVVEMLNGATIPSRKNGWSKDSAGTANVELHYAEHPEQSFRIRGVETTGQGTTSMDYWLWNIRHRIDKSVGKKCGISYWDVESGAWGAETQSGSVLFDGSAHPAVKRITAKINFASSMQSHKMGATRAYNELHDAMFNGAMLNDAQQAAQQAGDTMPTVAVYQYPAFGFLKIGDDYEFIGIFTIGPDKGDKPTFGYDRDEVKDNLITMEGPDHTPRLTMFSYPWNNNVKYSADEEKLCIVDGSDVVEGQGGWEVSNCCGLATDDRADETAVDTKLKQIFKPAYDAVYNNSTLIFPVALSDPDWGGDDAAEVVANINNDLATGGTFATTSYNGSRFKHLEMEFWVEGDYTLYHYDPVTGSYVAGTNLATDHGQPVGDTLDEQNEWFKAQRRARFMSQAPQYWNINECIFNFVFPLIFGATDNFGKNLYPYYMSATGKWCFRQDDLDTIFDIDNNGADTKAYWIEFADSDADGGIVFGGGASVFWNLIYECYQDDYDDGAGKGIRSFGAEMLATMRNISEGANIYDGAMEYIRRAFWNRAQEYLPVSAYNSDDNTKYLDAWIYENAPKVNPLTQALGNHYAAERRWVALRLMYVMSLFRVGPFSDYSDTTFGQIAFRPDRLPQLVIKTAAWLYPQVLVGQSGNKGTSRVAEGNTITFTNFEGGGQTSHYIKAADYILELIGLNKLVLGNLEGGKLTINAKRLTSLAIGDEDPEEVTTNVTALELDCPALEELDARNTDLSGALDLSRCGRIKEVLLENTEVSSVGIQKGCKIETLHLPDTVTELELLFTHFLDDLDVPNWAGITDLHLEECNALNTLEALSEAYNAVGSQLRNIQLRWNVLEAITAPVITMLAAIAAGKSAAGETVVYDADLEGQMKLDQGHYDADLEALQFQEVTPSIMAGYKEAVSTIFQHPLRLFYKDIVYMPFADPEVLRVLLQSGHYGDGVGITSAQVQAITNLGTIFNGNTQVQSFEEINEFGLTTIDADAFVGCTSLVFDNLNLPNLTSISGGAFAYFSYPSIHRSATIKKISNLGSITSLNPYGGYQIGVFMLQNLLESVVLPETLTTIGANAFNGCSSLKTINLPLALTTIGINALNGSPQLIIEDLNLPNLVDIKGSAFAGWDDSTLRYGVGARIKKVSNLGVITSIPSEGGRQIGLFMLQNLLESAVLPETITTIGANAFHGCSTLATMVVYANTPPSVGNYAFAYCPFTDGIYVPDESVDTYKAASGWSALADKFKPISELPTE